MRARLAGGLAVALTLAAGCEETPTQVLVHLDAEPASVARAARLRVQVLSPDETRLDRTLSLGGERPQVSFPTTVPVVPRDGDASRTFVVEASLLDAADEPMSTVRSRFRFAPGERRDEELVFEDACLDVLCPEDQTCASGGCVALPAADAGAG